MRFLVVLPLVAALASAHLERRSQPGAIQPPPVDLRPLTWGDVNFISTTDTHGWLGGHPNDPNYSADFGDFASFLAHMREQAVHRRKDLFVVDSGDLHDGNGLSDATPMPGQASDPIFQKINYDMLAIGNHELYDNRIAEAMYYKYAPKWGKRYLTSNVFFKDVHANKTVPIGRLYSKFRGKFGTKVLAYGFLYNFAGNGNSTVVQKVEETIAEPWFQKSLKEDSDIIVVVGHTAVRFRETRAVVEAIRKVHPSKPLVVFGGHLHQRDFVQYDARAAGLAAGRFMETIGWMSVAGIHDRKCRVETNCIGKNLTFTRRYLDANVHTYKTHALSHPKQKFDTWKGQKITRELAKVRRSLNLTTVLGYAPQDYYLSRYPMTDDRSLLKLVANEVLPVVVDPKKGKPGVVIVNSGSQRYDVLKGPFTVDDTFVVSPFHNTFMYTTVKASMVKSVVEGLNNAPFQKRSDATDFLENQHTSRKPPKNYTLTPGYVTKDDQGTDGDDWPHLPIPYAKSPNYIASPVPAGVQPDDEVHIIWLSFFSNLMGPILKELDPKTEYTFSPYRTDIDSNSMWNKFVAEKWSKKV
ncbi:hypothetical protein BGW42_004753 [Actinomortierella wolfii]|nr:hypothetical protein BGW42_004753 [Actinomortierella wolfii]